MAYRAVLFDLFDTLVDLHYEQLPRDEHRGRSIPPTTRALHAAVADRRDISFEDFLDVVMNIDVEFRETRYAKGLELPTEERFGAVLDRLEIADADLPGILTEIHMGVIRGLTEVPAHHAQLLDRLAQRFRIGLCSNFSHSETALRILEESDFRRHLDAVVISDAVGIRKPRPEIFEAAIARLGVAPDEVIHVGDNLRTDVGGASACGLATAWITRRVADAERQLREHEGAAPDFVIADLAELPDLIEGDTS